MKKLCLVVAVLMVAAAPALAAVNITCTNDGNVVTVHYSVSEPNKVRAFALDITVDSPAAINTIDYNDPNYYIYPGEMKFIGGQVTSYGTPEANDANYAGTLPGLDSNGLTIEMGSLYYPTGDSSPNAPGTSGTLLKFKVCHLFSGCKIKITENAIRGGIVLTNAQAPSATNLPYTFTIVTVPPVPCPMTVPASDPDGAYTVSWTASTGATSYQLESSAPASGTTIYPLWVQIYSGTATSYNEKVGGGTWSYRVKATNANGSSDWCTGTNCVVAECLKSSATGYADWVKWRYPACWCFKRQCHGDINGLKVGLNWVQAADLSCFKSAYLKGDAVVAAITCSTGTTGTIGGICADLNHAKLGLNRVQAADLGLFKTYYLKGEAIVTCCDTATPAGDCTLVSGDPYNFWTN